MHTTIFSTNNCKNTKDKVWNIQLFLRAKSFLNDIFMRKNFVNMSTAVGNKHRQYGVLRKTFIVFCFMFVIH